jgi:CheY-like chemotaxis protein
MLFILTEELCTCQRMKNTSIINLQGNYKKIMAIKILLAEDDLQLIDMYRRKFEMEGFEVQFAEDGEKAIQIIDSGWKPDIALLDIMMPKVNGLDVLKHIKDKEGWEDVITVMLTNLGNESTAEEIYNWAPPNTLLRQI